MANPVALTYDTLPAQSNLRREIDEQGNLRISLAAGEPGTLARSASLYAAAWTSIIGSILIMCALVLVLMPFYLLNPRTRALNFLLLMAAGVFFSAMFLLVWWLEYRKRVDELERAALQMTVVSASPREVLIESVGPFGQISKSARPPLHLRCRRMRSARIECLQLEEETGEMTDVFPGLSAQELHWIAAEIHRATNSESV